MGRHAFPFTQEVLQVLEQYGDKGVEFDVVTQHFGPAVERGRLSKALSNLRQRELAHSKCERPRDGCRWFFGCGDINVDAITPTDFKRIQRARRMDRAKPVVFFGQGLAAPRAASVWAYANYFQEHRA